VLQPLVDTCHFSRWHPTPLDAGLPFGSLPVAPEYSQKIIDILCKRGIEPRQPIWSKEVCSSANPQLEEPLRDSLIKRRHYMA
jgi:hypothetical protein